MAIEEEGVYAYSNGRLRPLKSFEIPDGRNVIYFDNILCPFCKIFNIIWSMLVEDGELSSYNFIRAVCHYFERECSHPESKRAFSEFKVRRSPLVMLVLKENGRVVFAKELPPSKYNYDYLRIKKAILKAFEDPEAKEQKLES